MGKNNFDLFAEMIRNNDSRLQLAPLSNIHKMDIKGTNGYVTFGVPPEIVYQLMDKQKTFSGGFLLVDNAALKKYLPTTK